MHSPATGRILADLIPNGSSDVVDTKSIGLHRFAEEPAARGGSGVVMARSARGSLPAKETSMGTISKTFSKRTVIQDSAAVAFNLLSLG